MTWSDELWRFLDTGDFVYQRFSKNTRINVIRGNVAGAGLRKKAEAHAICIRFTGKASSARRALSIISASQLQTRVIVPARRHCAVIFLLNPRGRSCRLPFNLFAFRRSRGRCLIARRCFVNFVIGWETINRSESPCILNGSTNAALQLPPCKKKRNTRENAFEEDNVIDRGGCFLLVPLITV